MKVENVLIVGGSGFLGRHLAAELARRALRVTIPTRRRERAKHLIVLPTVDVVEADVNAPGVLERLAKGRDAVINLVGILHGNFERAHVELPRAIVAACRAGGVPRLLHVSALGAGPDAPSEYLRSKARGEEVVLGAAALDVTVFRPSVVFGPEDRFLNTFASLARYLPVLALACAQARFQPVYVGDVARAMAQALEKPEAHGKRYELCGPREYTLKALVEYACAATGRHRLVLGLPPSLSYLQARLLEWSPGPLMTRDNYRSMQVPNVCAQDCTLPFGLVPTALEAVAPAYLQ
ncbi:MAG: complex subunit family protein [Burkholderiales bacterium]|nr:complex subunit family protein [Burkholderiales bacterium]